MDVQFYGANCIVITHKNTRIVIDDNLSSLGKKSITKGEDVSLFTYKNTENVDSRLSFDGPGEYEVGDISITGIAAKPFMNDDSGKKVTMYRLASSEISILVTGHILGDLTEDQYEKVGAVDVLVVPVGNNGFTLDAIGALKLIKDIEPKMVIPTHYADKDLNYPISQTDLQSVIKELSMEPKEAVAKLKIKPLDLTDVTQLVILETL